jgi:hypothetical protein
LVIDRELPQVPLQRVIDFTTAQPDFRYSFELIPLIAGHKFEKEVQNSRATHIQEMATSDVQRTAVYHLRPAKPACATFLFEKNK